MKIQHVIITFLILNTICTTEIYSQTKTDNNFIVHNVTNFDHLVQAFIANDNYIQNDNYGVITTELRNTRTRPNWSHQYMYRILKNDAEVTIKPYWTMGVTLDLGMVESTQQLNPWKYRKGKNINAFIYQETMDLLNTAGYNEISFK